MIQQVSIVACDMDDFWVFGYGSLMWNPGFVFEERRPARLYGFRRALCIRSTVYRGTPQQPGLVLGLEPGGSCSGMAFRVPEIERERAIFYLRERELVNNVYTERMVTVRVAQGERARALTYVADPLHPQYAGGLAATDAARIVAAACGRSGSNADYLVNTVRHLEEMGIHDAALERVLAAFRVQTAGDGATPGLSEPAATL